MHYLFIHPTFAGQHHHIVRHLAANPANQIYFICEKSKHSALGAMGEHIDNVQLLEYELDDSHTKKADPMAQRFEQDTKRGRLIYDACKYLKEQIATPDIISCHPGWGGGLFLKDIFPDTPVLSYAEYYFTGRDSYDPRLPISEQDVQQARIDNATRLLSLTRADHAISPLQWQKQSYPPEFQDKISVIHDGIDTEAINPTKEHQAIELPNGIQIDPETPVITHVARAFEKLRGFDTFLKAAEIIQNQHKTAHIVVVGGQHAAYGKNIDITNTLENSAIDRDRIHMLGNIPYESHIQILQRSNAHIYLTVSTVLSWSCLEAMAAGALIIASDTPAVKEEINHEENGLLVDFFSPEEVAEAVLDSINNPEKATALGKNARQTILDHYSVEKTLPQHIELLEKLIHQGTELKKTG